jgi:hypothetical protein
LNLRPTDYEFDSDVSSTWSFELKTGSDQRLLSPTNRTSSGRFPVGRGADAGHTVASTNENDSSVDSGYDHEIAIGGGCRGGRRAELAELPPGMESQALAACAVRRMSRCLFARESQMSDRTIGHPPELDGKCVSVPLDCGHGRSRERPVERSFERSPQKQVRASRRRGVESAT